MFVKGDAVVVGRRPFRNTSLILQCYMERAGCFTVMAKGAFRRRRKAEPPSVPDLFERGEVVLYVRPSRDYAILGEWTLERPRPGLRSDYEALRAASGCAAIAAALGRVGDAEGGLFGPLDRALGEIDAGGRPRQALWSFALQAFARAGFLAPLDRCAACGRPFAGRGRKAGDGPRVAGLSPGMGGLVCAGCSRDRPDGDPPNGREDAPPRPGGPAVVRLPPEAASAARFLATAPPGAASRLKVTARAAAALERAVRSLAEYHLERPMPVLSPGNETASTAKTPRAPRTSERGREPKGAGGT